MIENGIARFNIAQKVDKRNLIRLRTRKRAHDEIEISRSKPRPTIRSDHRDLILRERRAYGKSDYKGVPRNTGILFAKGRIRPVCGPVRHARFEPARFKTRLTVVPGLWQPDCLLCPAPASDFLLRCLSFAWSSQPIGTYPHEKVAS